MRELDGVDGSLRADNIGDVRDRSSTRGTEVQDLLAWTNVNVVETAEDASGQLGPERVPHAVLDFFSRQRRVGRVGLFDRDALLAIDRLARDEVARDEEVLLALGDKDARVTVRFEDNLGAALGADAALAAASATSGRTTSTSTAAGWVASRGRYQYAEVKDRRESQ